MCANPRWKRPDPTIPEGEVAARSNSEAWVGSTHLSDSVSIVDLTLTPPRVTRTLLVGDEPRDIVFAGSGGNRAFVTTALRSTRRRRPCSTRLSPGSFGVKHRYATAPR
jgi:hypothetical protein